MSSAALWRFILFQMWKVFHTLNLTGYGVNLCQCCTWFILLLLNMICETVSFVSACKECCIYSSFLCCHLHWDLPQRKTNQRNMNLLWIAFADFAKLCRFYFQYGIWDWNSNSLSGM